MTGGPPQHTTTPLPLSRYNEAAHRKARRQGNIVFHRVDRLPVRLPRSETIGGLAAAGEIVALVGAPSSGKSALATLAARALSDGSTFLGRPVLRGATIYVAAERAGEVERRLRAAAAPEAAIYVSGSRPQLAEPSSIDELVRAIMEVAEGEPLPIRLIILDTAARCFSGLDENSSRDMGLAAEGMAKILDEVPTATLIVVHHMDKLGSSMRGSTALLGAVDLELTVRGSGAVRRVEVTKANAVAEGQRLSFRLVVKKADDGLDVIEAEAADEQGRESGPKAASRLPPDARTALEALASLAGDNATPLDQWRDETMARFGDRKPPAKRKAWSTALKTLSEAGRIAISDEGVSVSDA